MQNLWGTVKPTFNNADMPSKILLLLKILTATGPTSYIQYIAVNGIVASRLDCDNTLWGTRASNISWALHINFRKCGCIGNQDDLMLSYLKAANYQSSATTGSFEMSQDKQQVLVQVGKSMICYTEVILYSDDYCEARNNSKCFGTHTLQGPLVEIEVKSI